MLKRAMHLRFNGVPGFESLRNQQRVMASAKQVCSFIVTTTPSAITAAQLDDDFKLAIDALLEKNKVIDSIG